MNLVELDGALRKLRLSGMAATLEARLRQAQSEKQAPIDLVSALVGDELLRRQDRLITRRIQQARFRDAERSLDTVDLDFNKKMNRALIHDLATARFIALREDALFLGPPAPARVTSPKPLAGRRFSKATASSTAKPTSSWRSWPTRRSTAHARPSLPS
jgi:IstB-like ATP binding protein